jgi:hypothetical protein
MKSCTRKNIQMSRWQILHNHLHVHVRCVLLAARDTGHRLQLDVSTQHEDVGQLGFRRGHIFTSRA